MVNSRAKGKRGELEFRDVLRSHGWQGARRGQQFSGGAESPDVMGGPAGIHIEVKFGGRPNISEAMEQAVRDLGAGEIPLVASRIVKRAKSGEWLLTMRASDLLPLLRKLEKLPTDHAS